MIIPQIADMKIEKLVLGILEYLISCVLVFR